MRPDNASRSALIISDGSDADPPPRGASTDAIDCPDRLVFNLGFVPDVPFEAVKLAALDVHAPARIENRRLQTLTQNSYLSGRDCSNCVY